MKLYSAPLSLFARKVEIALGEKGLSFERVMVPFTQAEGYHPKHPDVLAANPKGQVPILVDNGLTIFDSTVILEYLEDAYPSPPFYPDTPRLRAECRLFEVIADEILLAPVRALMHRTGPKSADADRQVMREADAKQAEPIIAAHYLELDRQLTERSYLCGAFSAADIAMFTTVLYALRLGGPSLASYAGLSDWYDRLRARPAFAAVRAEILRADQELSIPVDGPGEP